MQGSPPIDVFSVGLEHVTNAESNVAPMEVGVRDEPEARTDVEAQLNGDGRELIFNTSLTSNTEGDVAIATIVAPESCTGTDASKPAKAAANFALPLVDASQTETGVAVAAAPSEVNLGAVAKVPHGREFGAKALSTTEADSDSLELCAGHGAHCEHGYDCDK